MGRSRGVWKRWQRNTSRGLVPLMAVGAAAGGQVALAADPPVEAGAEGSQVESFTSVGAYEACEPSFGDGKSVGIPVFIERNGQPLARRSLLPSGFRLVVEDENGAVICDATGALSATTPLLAGLQGIYAEVFGSSPAPTFTPPGLFFVNVGNEGGEIDAASSFPEGSRLRVVSGASTAVAGSPFALDAFQPALSEDQVNSLMFEVVNAIEGELSEVADNDTSRAIAFTQLFAPIKPTYLRTGLGIAIHELGLWNGCMTPGALDPYFADPVGSQSVFIDIATACGFDAGTLEITAVLTALLGMLPQHLLLDGPNDPEADPPYLRFGVTVPTSTPPPPPPPPPLSSIEKRAGAGETVSTLPPGAKVTPEAPVGVSVTTPVAGTVSITTTVGEPEEAASGFSMLGLSVTITAPTATWQDPLNLSFVLDASQYGDEDPMTVVPLRNGEPVPDCDEPDGTSAEPDPCVGGRSVDEDGDLTINVRTSAASTWTFGIALATPTPVPDPGCAPSVFTDVPRGGTHTTAIDCAAFRGITQGFGDGTFRPAEGVRRDQMASFLVRTLEVAGHPLPASAQEFTDVGGNVHAEAIGKLAAAGIVQGTSAGTYSPDAVVSRAQMASFLTRALSWGGVHLPPGGARYFSDTVGDAHADAIDAAFQLGLVLGKSVDSYDPSGQVRRDQMASFLMRLFDKL